MVSTDLHNTCISINDSLSTLEQLNAVKDKMHPDLKWMIFGGEKKIKAVLKTKSGSRTNRSNTRVDPRPWSLEDVLKTKMNYQGPIPSTTPGCAWVHPSCKVVIAKMPIQKIIPTKMTPECWCGEKLKDVDISTELPKLPEATCSKVVENFPKRVALDLPRGHTPSSRSNKSTSGHLMESDHSNYRLPPIVGAKSLCRSSVNLLTCSNALLINSASTSQTKVCKETVSVKGMSGKRPRTRRVSVQS